MYKFTLIFILILLIFSCKSGNKLPAVEKELQAYSTKLQQDLKAYYRKNPDSLKCAAALFLARNCIFHSHAYGKRIDLYSKHISALPHNSFEQEKHLENLEKECQFMYDEFQNDRFELICDSIIRHVDKVVDYFRKSGWNKQVSVSDFCNYVLPYAVQKEKAGPWTDYFRKDYYVLNDSSYLRDSLAEATGLIHQWLHRKTNGFRYGQNLQYLNYLSPVVLDKLLIGSCSELTRRSTACMRALGIPVTTDVVPCYLNFKSGHSWNVAILDSSRFIPFDSSSARLYEYSNKRLGLPKVYRETFEPQDFSHLAARGRCSFLPELFNSPFYKDVTTSYVQTSDLDVPVKYRLPRKIKYAYLSVFTRNGWTPVCWTEIKKHSLSFRNTGRGGVYLPVSIEADGMRPLNAPFILSDSGEINYLSVDTTRHQRLDLLRKYPIDERKRLFTQRMIGGVFQGANHADFSDARLLSRIDSNPGEYFNSIVLKADRKYRYVRYLSPRDSYCNVAEIGFYEDSVSTAKLKGEIIGTPGVWINNTKSTKTAAFDGNVLTYMDSEDADYIWIGLDFGQKERVVKIRFIARNDMNAIQTGNEYELYYWDNRWVSLGRQTATGHHLIYDNAPLNALFWLKNHTEGVEERIFTYEHGEQVWW